MFFFLLSFCDKCEKDSVLLFRLDGITEKVLNVEQISRSLFCSFVYDIVHEHDIFFFM